MLVSALYWMAAAGIVVLAGVVVPGDCGTGRTSVAVSECLKEVRLIVLAALALAAVLYGLLLRQFTTLIRSGP